MIAIASRTMTRIAAGNPSQRPGAANWRWRRPWYDGDDAANQISFIAAKASTAFTIGAARTE